MDKKQILYRTYLKRMGVVPPISELIQLSQYNPHMYWSSGEFDLWLEDLVDFLIEEL